jgi:hypothetical protein
MISHVCISVNKFFFGAKVGDRTQCGSEPRFRSFYLTTDPRIVGGGMGIEPKSFFGDMEPLVRLELTISIYEIEVLPVKLKRLF